MLAAMHVGKKLKRGLDNHGYPTLYFSLLFATPMLRQTESFLYH